MNLAVYDCSSKLIKTLFKGIAAAGVSVSMRKYLLWLGYVGHKELILVILLKKNQLRKALKGLLL
ncbi:MAG: hypothetical protein JNL74_03495 [Fibrobacteres bacterium]|nr:hypothetical protein [Fibrobacterota bacterium]